MLQDNCILVDSRDVITGSANKQDSHKFSPAQPQGLLHRAFSVFLFDSSGRLLLQQRAKDKITFPGGSGRVCCMAGCGERGRQGWGQGERGGRNVLMRTVLGRHNPVGTALAEQWGSNGVAAVGNAAARQQPQLW